MGEEKYKNCFMIFIEDFLQGERKRKKKKNWTNRADGWHVVHGKITLMGKARKVIFILGVRYLRTLGT